jgi:hypothetical protein
MSVDVQPDTLAARQGEAGDSCPACRERLVGEYCHRCGEERFDPASLSLRRFAVKTFQELTDLEHSKIFRTLKSLLLRPGFLTNEFLAGRRSLYLSPLKVVLVTFAVSFFLYTFYRPVAVYDVRTMIENDWTGQWAKMIGEMAAEKHVTVDTFIAEVNEKWQFYMSLLQLSNVLFCAVLLQLLYLFSRRYFVEHLVFSMHFFSFTYVVPAILWPLYLYVGVGLTKTSAVLSAAVVAGIVFYLFLALRAVYGGSKRMTLLKAGGLYLGTYVIMSAMMLVTLVMAFVHVFITL